MVALGAMIVVQGPDGERRIAAQDFFLSHFQTVLEENEIVTAVEVPVAADTEGSAFLEVAARYGDFAMAGAAATVTIGEGEGSAITDARISCIAVGETPVRMSDAEAGLVGQVPTPDVLTKLAAAVEEALSPTPSLKASAAYKKRTAGVLAARAVRQAWGSIVDRNSEPVPWEARW
jgi:carbon-monoxide dehydrogenase medium subunit